MVEMTAVPMAGRPGERSQDMDPWVLPRLPVQQQEKRYSRIEAVPISLPPTPDLSFKFPSPKPSATFSTISSTNSPPPKRSCFLPFLDFMSPARQLPLAWTSAVLTFVFLILTAVYSSQLTVASRLRFLYGSSSNTIFILSVLSGLTGIFLAATMAAAFERLQWLLLIRADGLQLSKFLSLQAGTGVPGLLLLTFGKGHPITTSTRLWSAGRLLAITLVPALGILIMSNVNTRMTFDTIDGLPLDMGWGISPFNASLAKNVSTIAEELSQAGLATFLSDPSNAKDITSSELRAVPCAQSPFNQPDTRCERTFFLPGGVQLAAPVIGSDIKPLESNAFLAKSQQSYLLNFKEGEQSWSFSETDCQVYGFSFAAIRLCLKNEGENTLQAKIINCPSTTAGALSCQIDTTWLSSKGWTTSLTTNFIRANVAYSRSNGSILSQEFEEETLYPTRIDAQEMLTAYRWAYGNFSGVQDLLSLLTNPEETSLFTLRSFPALVWGCLKGISSLGSQNPAVNTKAADTLQCLLAIMLYYCQPSLFARKFLRLQTPPENPKLRGFYEMLKVMAPADTRVSLAGSKFQIIVGQGTLVAYVILCGVALVLCLVVLSVGSLKCVADRIPDTTPFPSWDNDVHCEMKRVVNGDEVEAARGAELGRLKGGEMVKAAAGMRVRLAVGRRGARL